MHHDIIIHGTMEIYHIAWVLKQIKLEFVVVVGE